MKHTTKTPQQSIKEIRPESLYRLVDIAKAGWILNTVGISSKRFLYRLIEHNKLPARDVGFGKSQKLWMVRGEDLIAFIKRYYL